MREVGGGGKGGDVVALEQGMKGGEGNKIKIKRIKDLGEY